MSLKSHEINLDITPITETFGAIISGVKLSNQMSQDEKCKKSSYCILNDNIENLNKRILEIHNKLV